MHHASAPFSFAFSIFAADPEPKSASIVPFFKIIFGCLVVLLLASPVSAQVRPLPVVGKADLGSAVQALAGAPSQVRGDVRATEAILDLIRPGNLDSVLLKVKQRHVGALGWVMHQGFARFWVRQDSVKRKYIGSSSRPLIIWDGFKNEMDINIFLMPNLPHYVKMARAAFDNALEIDRPEEFYRIDRPPFTPDEALKYKDLGYFTVECEVTPPEAGRAAFSELFFPMTPGENSLKDDPRFGIESPSVGLYGSWCLDCNHNCRPEIHPIEWMWWLDMQPDDPAHPEDWQWLVGLMHDETRRFEDWSRVPLQGRIAIPIVVPAGAQRYVVRVQALVQAGLQALTVPAAPGSQALTSQTAQFQIGPSGCQLDLEILGLPGTEHAQWQLSPFTEDRTTGAKLGYMHLAADTRDVLALRVSAGAR